MQESIQNCVRLCTDCSFIAQIDSFNLMQTVIAMQKILCFCGLLTKAGYKDNAPLHSAYFLAFSRPVRYQLFVCTSSNAQNSFALCSEFRLMIETYF